MCGVYASSAASIGDGAVIESNALRMRQWREERRKKKQTKNGRHMTGFYLFSLQGVAAFRGNLWKRPAVRGITREEQRRKKSRVETCEGKQLYRA